MRINERLGFDIIEEVMYEEIPEQDASLEIMNNETESNNDTRVKREVSDEDQLSFADVELIYAMCRYEKAWYPEKISVWCAAFSEEDLHVRALLTRGICHQNNIRARREKIKN